MQTQIITVSSKGQIVLPLKIREEMAIKQGDKLALVVSKGSIILKPLDIPSALEVEEEVLGYEANLPTPEEAVKHSTRKGKK